jgi:hypothetical protein
MSLLQLERILRAGGVLEATPGEESSSEEDEDERRDGATYKEAMDARRVRITSSMYAKDEDD